MSKARIRLGDVFGVPLNDGNHGYVQYIAQNDKRGPLIRALDITTPHVLTNVDCLHNVGNRFPPVLANFWAEVKAGAWPFVGRLPVLLVEWPLMIANAYNYKIKRLGTWYLVDAEHDHRLGEHLPPEYAHLEPAIIWSAENIAHRIRTGKHKDWLWKPRQG